MQPKKKPNRWDGKQGMYHWNVGDSYYRLDVQGCQFVILSYVGAGHWEPTALLSDAASHRIYGKMWSTMNDPDD